MAVTGAMTIAGSSAAVPARVRAAILAPLIVAAGLASVAVNADPVAAANEARLGQCRHEAGLAPLAASRALDHAATLLAHGRSLHQALGTLGVRPSAASALHLTGVDDDRAVTRALAGHFCATVAAREFREIGAVRTGSALYLIVAAPLPVPVPEERAAVQREVLERINLARSRARACGGAWYPAAAPLILSNTLSRVAAGHSAAMAAREDLAHEDPDGSTPADRVRRAGYVAGLVGENLASGVPTAAEVVAGWLASPGHCANIMDRRFRETGIAYVVAPHAASAIYWTQLFAIPRT